MSKINTPCTNTELIDAINEKADGYEVGSGLNLENSILSVDKAEIQEKLISGSNIEINGNEISATGDISVNYENATNKPSINGNVLSGNKSSADIGITYESFPDIPSINGNVLTGNNSGNELELVSNRVYDVTEENSGELVISDDDLISEFTSKKRAGFSIYIKVDSYYVLKNMYLKIGSERQPVLVDDSGNSYFIVGRVYQLIFETDLSVGSWRVVNPTPLTGWESVDGVTITNVTGMQNITVDSSYYRNGFLYISFSYKNTTALTTTTASASMESTFTIPDEFTQIATARGSGYYGTRGVFYNIYPVGTTYVDKGSISIRITYGNSAIAAGSDFGATLMIPVNRA